MTAPTIIAPGPAATQLVWTVGDDWTSQDEDEWAVLIDGGPVNLALPGWTVHGQVRSRSTGLLLASWSTATTDPAVAGTVVLGTAAVPLADGSFLPTSTVRLRHGVTVSRLWGAVAGEVEVEVTRRQNGVVTLNRSIARGTARGTLDTSQDVL